MMTVVTRVVSSRGFINLFHVKLFEFQNSVHPLLNKSFVLFFRCIFGVSQSLPIRDFRFIERFLCLLMLDSWRAALRSHEVFNRT